MPAFRLMVDGTGTATATTTVVHIEGPLGKDGASALCELPLVSAVSGLYDADRQHLFVSSKPSRLADQPEEVKALICATSHNTSTGNEFIVLLAPPAGATLLLPRQGVSNASEVRVRPAPTADGSAQGSGAVVVLARGPDPYAALLDAERVLADVAGLSADQVRSYALPLLDYASRMSYDAAIAASPFTTHGNANGARTTGAGGVVAAGKAADGAVASAAAASAAALEQQLHEGILVQAGPGCPAKPLLQAPGLRLCQGMTTPLGLRYSGMSVVYGTATGHVLAVMDTAAALKMAPAAGMRSSTGGSGGSSGGSGSGSPPGGGASSALGGADSPSGVSAGISAATSAAPSPPVSRASSCGGALNDAAPAAESGAKASSRGGSDSGVGATPLPPAPPALALSGRSVTAAPVIQIVAAAPAASPQQQPHGVIVPTTAPAHVLASFAIVGVRTVSGRDGVVRCCRIMPASALSAAAAGGGAAVAAVAAAAGTSASGRTGLGIVVQLEVSCAASGTLRLFLEGSEEPEAHALPLAHPHGLDLAACGREARAELPLVRHVAINGAPARWSHDAHGCMLAVTLPAAPPAASLRTVEVYL